MSGCTKYVNVKLKKYLEVNFLLNSGRNGAAGNDDRHARFDRGQNAARNIKRAASGRYNLHAIDEKSCSEFDSSRTEIEYLSLVVFLVGVAL